MNKLIIIGASGFGREVAWLVERINICKPTWELLGFVDDDENIVGSEINGYRVLGTTKALKDYKNCFLVCAVGSSILRKQIIDRLQEYRFATLVDPTVEMSNSVKIGDGTIVCAHNIMTVNITIGKHCIINLDCTIGHDAILNDYVTVYPGVNISGNTQFGRCVELGTGSQVIQGKIVGENTIVGAGSVVVKDLPNSCTAVGVPCTPIKFHGGQL